MSNLDVSTGDALSYDLLYNAVYDATVDALSAQETVTDGQAISSTALSYFEGILANKALPVDYVIYVGAPYQYKSGSSTKTAYEYCMAYGDLELSGTVFTGNATVCRIRTNGNYSVSYDYSQDISVDAPMYYSRSNMGDYSGVVDYDWTGVLILISLMLGGLVWFIKKLLRVQY